MAIRFRIGGVYAYECTTRFNPVPELEHGNKVVCEDMELRNDSSYGKSTVILMTVDGHRVFVNSLLAPWFNEV